MIACIDGQSIKYLPVVMYFCQLKHHIANYVMYVSNVVEIIVKVNWKSFVTRHSKWFWYDFFLLCCIFRCGEPRSGAWCEADMSPVIKASWRVHWRHVTWPLVGVKVSLQIISRPSPTVCCAWQYSNWPCSSSVEGHAQAVGSRYVVLFEV